MEFDTQIYVHVRILVSLVLGLGLTRLLTGISRFIQHPGQLRIYPIHMIWVMTIILTIMDFWWWEFALIRQHWTFALFAFVLFYAFLFFLLASLLFPDEMKEYSGFEDYFFSRRRWFFGLLAVSLIADFIDTLAKGSDHLAALGVEYEVRIPVAIMACIVAAVTESRRFHLAFAAAYLAYTISWIIRIYWRIG